MQFTYNEKEYRLERGMGVGNWLLLANQPSIGWKLLRDFPAFITEADIIDHAKIAINNGEDHYPEQY